MNILTTFVVNRSLTTVLLLSTLLLTVGINSSHASEIQTQGAVCGHPTTPCQPPIQSFMQTIYEPYDITFDLPKTLTWQTTYLSESFYAIILKSKKSFPDDGPASDKPCAGFFSEDERKAVQELFPGHKVFTSRFGCSGHPIFYTNTNADYNYIAVFGGATLNDAKALLKTVKENGFSDANIRKVQVGLSYGD